MKNINIKEKFHPFCENCPNMDLSVEYDTLFGIGGSPQFFLTISCNNYNLCCNLKKHLGGEENGEM